MNIKKIFESLKLGNIAGMGAKGISIAPLFNLESEKNMKKIFNITKVILLKDGWWYCPECGNHNKNLNVYCNSCGLYRK